MVEHSTSSSASGILRPPLRVSALLGSMRSVSRTEQPVLPACVTTYPKSGGIDSVRA
jgi:hypothetical protein